MENEQLSKARNVSVMIRGISTSNIVIGVVALGVLILAGVFYFSRNLGGSEQTTPPITSEPEVVESRDALVAGFPDFPSYPGAKIETSRVASDSQGKHFEAYLVSNQSVSEVSKWYSQELLNDGWEQLDESGDERNVDKSMVFQKGKTKVGLTIEDEHSGNIEIAIYLTEML